MEDLEMEKKIMKSVLILMVVFLIMGALPQSGMAQNPSDNPVLLHRWSFNGSSDPGTWPSDPNDPAHPLRDSVAGANASIFGTAKITDNTLDLSTNTPNTTEATDPNGGGWASLPLANTWSSLTDGFTIEAWFYLDGHSANSRILDSGELTQYDEIYLSERDPGIEVDGLAGGIYNDGFLGTTYSDLSVSLETWHHVVYTSSKTVNQAYLYLDGSPVASATAGAAPSELAPLTASYIGRCYIDNWPHVSLLKGRIDELRIYGEMMTEARMKSNFRCGPDDMGCPLDPTTCQEALDDGYSLASDFNHDCRVNLEDFALFAAEWMRCIIPTEESCEKPWQ